VAWAQVVALAANLLDCFRLLALPRVSCATPHRNCCATGCCTCPPASPEGQRKWWLHLRADWPWTDDVINSWRAVKALPAPT